MAFRPKSRWMLFRSILKRLLILGVRCSSSPAILGLLLSVYGLSTHYLSSMRKYAPLKSDDWFDVKSHIGNVFYSAFSNTWEFIPNLFTGRFSQAIDNLTNIAGIRSEVYTRLIHSDAVNNAESFTRIAPWIIFSLVGVRILHYTIRYRQRLRLVWIRLYSRLIPRKRSKTKRKGSRKQLPRKHHFSSKELRFFLTTFDRSIIYFAQVGIASAALTAVFLNTVEYYQGLSGVAGLVGQVGAGLATAIDYLTATGSFVFNELLWHGLFMATEGKEKALGWFTQDKSLEYLSHYLAKMPTDKIPDALHTAVYQAVFAGALWSIAHYTQKRLARNFARKLDALPPHMQRYLARRKH